MSVAQSDIVVSSAKVSVYQLRKDNDRCSSAVNHPRVTVCGRTNIIVNLKNGRFV